MGKRRRPSSSSISESQSRDRLEPSISPPRLIQSRSAKLSLSTDKEMAEVEQRFEILSWNINGASRFLNDEAPKITLFFNSPSPSKAATKDDGPDAYIPLRKFLELHAWPQVVCLQEVKINPQDLSTKRALEKVANDSGQGQESGPAYTAHFSLPRDKHNAKGFGGKVHGVCTLIHTSLLPSSTT